MNRWINHQPTHLIDGTPVQPHILALKTRDVHPMLYQWWASVCDAGPPLIQHWVNVFYMLCRCCQQTLRYGERSRQKFTWWSVVYFVWQISGRFSFHSSINIPISNYCAFPTYYFWMIFLKIYFVNIDNLSLVSQWIYSGHEMSKNTSYRVNLTNYGLPLEVGKRLQPIVSSRWIIYLTCKSLFYMLI